LDGRWIVYGAMGGIKLPGETNLGLLLAKRVKLEATTLRNRSNLYKKELIFNF